MRAFFLFILCSPWLLPTPALAQQQYVFLDIEWEHTADIADSHYYPTLPASMPINWTSPVNYAAGTAHMWLEVRSKPSDAPTKVQLCYEGEPTYSCDFQSDAFVATGVVEWSDPFSEFWSPDHTDWTKAPNRVAVIVKDDKNAKPSADNVGAKEAARYMPLDLRLVVTFVPPGATYVAPSANDAGVAADASVDASAPVADAGVKTDASLIVTDASVSDGSSTREEPIFDDEAGCSVIRRSPLETCSLLVLGFLVTLRLRHMTRARFVTGLRNDGEANALG